MDCGFSVEDRNHGALRDLGGARQRAVRAHRERRARADDPFEEVNAQLVADEVRRRVLQRELHPSRGGVANVNAERGLAVQLEDDVPDRPGDAHLLGRRAQAMVHADAPGAGAEHVQGRCGVARGVLCGADVGRLESPFVAGCAADNLRAALPAVEELGDEPLSAAGEPVGQQHRGQVPGVARADLAPQLADAARELASDPFRVRPEPLGKRDPGGARVRRNEQHGDSVVDESRLGDLAGRRAADDLAAAGGLGRRRERRAQVAAGDANKKAEAHPAAVAVQPRTSPR